MIVSKTTKQQKLVPTKTAWMIVIAGILIYTLAGLVIGYKFVWNQYNTASRYEQEIADATKKVKEKPNDIGARLELGFRLLKVRKYEEARREYSAALRIDPKSNLAKLNMADLLIEIKNYQEADKLLNEIIKVEPGFQVYALLGKSSYLQNKYPDAIQSFSSARDLNPTDTEVLYFLGLSYEKTGNKDLAIENFNEVLKFDPNHKDIKVALKRLNSK